MLLRRVAELVQVLRHISREVASLLLGAGHVAPLEGGLQLLHVARGGIRADNRLTGSNLEHDGLGNKTHCDKTVVNRYCGYNTVNTQQLYTREKGKCSKEPCELTTRKYNGRNKQADKRAT